MATNRSFCIERFKTFILLETLCPGGHRSCHYHWITDLRRFFKSRDLNRNSCNWYSKLHSRSTVSTHSLPFSRFAYESIVEFVMGNNVIISNALLFLTYKYISYAILLCFSFVIAPIGMIILFFYNKHQFKLAQEQAVQATEQNQ